MAELVNLNRARKARAKADQAAEAQANRLRHGRTKAQKRADQAEAERARRAVDDAKREP